MCILFIDTINVNMLSIEKYCFKSRQKPMSALPPKLKSHNVHYEKLPFDVDWRLF